MSETIKNELLKLTQKLLDSVTNGHWETYEALCDPALSAFEPEARGHLIEGMPFHKFYFELERDGKRPVASTISSPHVRLLRDDVAIVAYVRLVQTLDSTGVPVTHRFEETRIWQRHDGHWRHVHFHRSANA